MCFSSVNGTDTATATAAATQPSIASGAAITMTIYMNGIHYVYSNPVSLSTMHSTHFI